MATDTQTFAITFALVWGGLALYLLWLHRVARGLEERLARLERGGGPDL
jgi:hypothetical protein